VYATSPLSPSAFAPPRTFRALPRKSLAWLASVIAVGLGQLACQSAGGPKTEATASANPASTGSSTSDQPASSGEAASTQPRGSVQGVIRVKGDAPPTIESMASKIPVGKCFRAHETYAKLFREGPGRTLADVLVAVTRYDGEPAKPPREVRIEAKDCALDRRTVALSLGQTLAVHNAGAETYTPQLMGYPSQALMLAVPGGDPVRFKPEKVGQYQLIDRSHEFVFADVFIVDYPTLAVSGLDGKFEVTGVPAGKAKLSALLPITGQTIERDVDVPADGAVKLELEFSFDAAKDGAKAAPLGTQ
jgi:hypothetical protein